MRIASPFAAPIWRSDVDASESFAVVSNAGKALTVWPLGDTRSVLTARVPLRNDQRRRAHAVAISPNAELIAYSVPPLSETDGRTKQGSGAIYIMRRASGRILHILNRAGDDIATRPQALKFSPDGVHLAAVLSSGCGVRVWTTRDWKLVLKDDQGYGDEFGIDRCCRTADAQCDMLPDTTGLNFLKPVNDQPYLVTAGDTGIRVYDKHVERVTRRAFVSPDSIDVERPSGVVVSPDGRQLLIGDRRNRNLPPPMRLRLALLDSATLRPIRRPLEIRESALLSGAFLQGGPQVSDLWQSSLDRVAWLRTKKGNFAVGAGAFPCEIVRPELLTLNRQRIPGELCLARWDLDTPDADPRFVPVGTERVIDIVAMPRRGGILTSSQKSIALLDIDGTPVRIGSAPVLEVPNTAIDLRDADLQFTISPDGRVVSMEDYRARAGLAGAVIFDLGRLKVTSGQGDEHATIAPDQGVARSGGLNIIEGWRNADGRRPLVLGRQLTGPEYRRGELFRAVAVRREQQRLVLASSEFLRVIDYSTGEARVQCREPVTDEAYRVNITPDGSLIVSGHSDGTIRWYRVHPAPIGCRIELLVTAHLAESTPGTWTWAAWRPSGFYARDMGSDLRLEWQRTGRDGQVQLTPFERLLRWIDRDAVRTAADPPVSAVSGSGVNAGAAQVPDEDYLEAEQRTEHSIEILGRDEDRDVSTEEVNLHLALAEGKGWPKRLGVRLADETPVATRVNGRSVVAGGPIVVTRRDLVEGVLPLVVVLPGKARAQADSDFQICFTVDEVADACHKMKWRGAVAPRPPRRLWAAFIGVSKSAEGSDLDLRFPQNDAIDLARVFVADHDARVKLKTSSTPPDYEQMQIDLILSATAEAESEIAELTQRPWVKRHMASKAGIANALQRTAQAIAEANRVAPGDDIFLLTFSGHGLVDPFPRKGANAGSLFLTAETRKTWTPEAMATTALSSTELLHLLRQIPARKVIILDACRSVLALPNARPFSPEHIRAEFEKEALDAHFFFSSDAGQESFELPEAAFDTRRSPELRGNGLFTYALLNALTKLRPNVPPHIARKIEIPGVADYLRLVFFNTADPANPATALQKLNPTALPYVPTPRYIPARLDSAEQLVRTLDLPSERVHR